MTDPGHTPVLLEETMRLLDPRPGEIAVDLTVGRGGHALAMAERIGPAGRVIGFDLDPRNLASVAQRFEAVAAEAAGDRPAIAPFTAVHANFAAAPEHLHRMNLRADIVLADLGFSSTQMDDPKRGFSFTADGPLDMRLNRPPEGASPTGGDQPTAAELVASLSERELADLIYEYGEDPYARRIARKLVESRRAEPILTTARLAGLVREAYGPRARSSRMHPATRTFMALRIAVNDELGALRMLLDQIIAAAEERTKRDSWLHVDSETGARVGIISFHSLEDRSVKHAFADMASRHRKMDGRSPHRPVTQLTRKPVTAGEHEARANPRSRSAKLRVVRIGGPRD